MEDNKEINLGLSVMRATEAAAITAARWVGRGSIHKPDQLAANAMRKVLDRVEMDGIIVVGEEAHHADSTLAKGSKVGVGSGPSVDVAVDAVDGIRLLAEGLPDAVSAIALAPRGSMRSLGPSIYMEKIVVTAECGHVVTPEAFSAPVGWVLESIARAIGKPIHDLTIFVLKRLRHKDIIHEIRSTGARVLMRQEGDVTGAILAARPEPGVDVLMGVGGTIEGIASACAVKALQGTMLARLAPQSYEERKAILDAGLDVKQIYTCDDLVTGSEVYFAATGITDGLLLHGVRFSSDGAATHSLVLNGASGTRRQIFTEHSNRKGLS